MRKLNFTCYFFVFVLLVVISLFIYVEPSKVSGSMADFEAVSPVVATSLGLDVDSKGFGLYWLHYGESVAIDDVMAFVENPSIANEGWHVSLYTSEVGLHAFALSLIAKMFNNVNVFILFRGGFVFLFVIVIWLIGVQLNKRYGKFFSICFTIVTLFSPWTNAYARNLYFAEFLFFIPMLVGLMWLNYEDKRKYIEIMFFLTVFVKCLCGYEFISTIMVGELLFIVPEWLVKPTKKGFVSILRIGIISILGFSLALLIHAYVCGEGSLAKGFEFIRVNMIERRLYGSADNYDIVYADSLNASALEVIKKYLWTEARGKVLSVIILFSGAILGYNKFIKKEHISGLIYIFMVAFLGAISWLIIGKAHSYIHTHLCFIVFYMGFMQMCFYIIARCFFVNILSMKIEDLFVNKYTGDDR